MIFKIGIQIKKKYSGAMMTLMSDDIMKTEWAFEENEWWGGGVLVGKNFLEVK